MGYVTAFTLTGPIVAVLGFTSFGPIPNKTSKDLWPLLVSLAV